MHEDPRFAQLRAHIRGLVMQEYEAQARQAAAGCRLTFTNSIRHTQETTMTLRRRTLLQAAAAASARRPRRRSPFAQARTKVKVGYLHTPAVDGQIWLGQQIGRLEQAGPGHGVDPVHRPAWSCSRP